MVMSGLLAGAEMITFPANREAIEEQLKEIYADYYDKELGKVVAVIEILDVGEGIIAIGIRYCAQHTVAPQMKRNRIR